MVRKQKRPLDRQYHRNYNLRPDRLHHLPVPLRLHPNVVPPIRCFPLRRQRSLSLRFRFRSRPVCATHVPQTRHWKRRQLTSRLECLGYRKLEPSSVAWVLDMTETRYRRLGCGSSTSTARSCGRDRSSHRSKSTKVFLLFRTCREW